MGDVSPAGTVSVGSSWKWKWDPSLTSFIPRGNRFKDITGQRFGKLTALYPVGANNHKLTIWRFFCDCGSVVDIPSASVVHENSRSCGCSRKGRNHHNWKGCGKMPGWYLSVLNARSRTTGHYVGVTTEDLAELFNAQGGRCALSGIPLIISEQRSREETTASLDRIDSSIGYIRGNIQWVHKDVNMMKQRFSQEHFINLCTAIADYCRGEDNIHQA